MVVFVESACTSDHDAGDPLLRAIADLRDELNRLIDEQVASVGALEARALEPSLAPAPVSAPAPVHSDFPGDRYAVAPATAANGGKTGKRPQRTSPAGDLPTTPPPDPAPAPAPPSSESAGDPRLRLDALAKRLDGRLKRGNGGPGERPKGEGDG